MGDCGLASAGRGEGRCSLRIDVDQSLAVAAVQQKALPWDLTLAIGGQDYRVKPITNADMAELSRIQDEKEVENLRLFLVRMLEGEVMGSFTDEQVGSGILAIAIGFGEHVKK